MTQFLHQTMMEFMDDYSQYKISGKNNYKYIRLLFVFVRDISVYFKLLRIRENNMACNSVKYILI